MKSTLKNILNAVKNVTDDAKETVPKLQNKVSQMYDTSAPSSNPFLNKKGELINKYINYQKVLDNPNANQKAKLFISQATGLTPANPTPTILTGVSKQVSSTGNSIVDAAKKYIGTPYVWGGESVAEGGMDCSGFVYSALKDAGYNVGRDTAQGYRSYGTSVNKADMQPGDLIFFGKGEASHIGIYIGNGQMIHSSGGSRNTASNPGKGVEIRNVDYRSDFLEARRY